MVVYDEAGMCCAASSSDEEASSSGVNGGCDVSDASVKESEYVSGSVA